MKSICVYCGANFGANPIYAEVARALGQQLAREGITLVYGGGSVGLMNTVAQGAMDAGGHVVGVITEALMAREVGRSDLATLHVVPDMHTRKAKMADLADGFIAMPGGFGTLDELFEMITWGQLGIHRKPIGLLDVNGFYAPLLTMVDHMIRAGFVRTAHRALFVNADSIGALLAALRAWTPVDAEKWLPSAKA
jgi:uncharacterized protein (TIGR00730 family)